MKLFQGAIRWTAPELIAVDTDDEENQAILPACDIWSFGCVCAEVKISPEVSAATSPLIIS